MAQLFLDEDIPRLNDSEDDMLAQQEENGINYKGQYGNEEPDEEEQKYFEYGAHFSYANMVERLEQILETLSLSRRETPQPAKCFFKAPSSNMLSWEESVRKRIGIRVNHLYNYF